MGTLGMQSYSSDRSGTGKPVARGVKDVNENTAPSSRERRLTHHLFRCSMFPISRKSSPNVRQKLSRPEGDEMLDVDGMSWGIFMPATVKAAVHLGQEYEEILRKTKNTDFEQVTALFDISPSVILDNTCEINGISTIEWNTTPWMRSTLQHDRAIKLSKGQVHVALSWKDSLTSNFAT